jgi:nucleotide-binding universal stress UspA family protein
LPTDPKRALIFARAPEHRNPRNPGLDARQRGGAPCAYSEQKSTGARDAAIVELARELDCDMIVMVTHGRGAFGELLFGSHTKNVLSKSNIPLLVLH